MRRFHRFLPVVAVAVASLLPATLRADDQQIAGQIAQVMRVSGAMKDYDVAVNYAEGTAILQGTVASEQQLKTAIQIAQASPHVNQVKSELDIVSGGATSSKAGYGLDVSMPRGPQPRTASALSSPSFVRPVAAEAPVAARRARPAPRQVMAGRAMPMPIGASRLAGGPGAGFNPAMGRPGMGPGRPGGPYPAHMPGAGGGVAPASHNQPQLPGHAWPSYTAYPNYAGLTYPKQYSPTAWPYIGPFYPYPQVPLGWRKVTLEWDDGWWMLDFND